MTIEVRPEGPGDEAAVRAVHKKAFGQSEEAGLMSREGDGEQPAERDAEDRAR